MKFFLICGEASGDLHGANLIKAIKQLRPEAQFTGIGGDQMRAEGMQLIKHYNTFAVMGLVDVLKKLPLIWRTLRETKKNIEREKPDGIILIDFSGFNLKIAQWARQMGICVHYYIAPQVWASRSQRVEKIKAYVDHVYAILPFETEFYRRYGMEVTYVGHPLLDALTAKEISPKEVFLTTHQLDQTPIIALLPGSRKQEIKAILPIMLETAQLFPEYQWVIAQAPGVEDSFYDSFIRQIPQIKRCKNDTYALLNYTHLALVTSGTATLETALMQVPQIVCYKTQWLTYQIAKRVVRLSYISLVNIISNRLVVPECIQEGLTVSALTQHVQHLIKGPARTAQLDAYGSLYAQLGGPGASRKAAAAILKNNDL